MLSKNKWYKYIILSSLCYAMVDNFGKSFCTCHCCDKDDSGDDFWSRMPVNLSRYNLLDGCYALLSYERGANNYLIDCGSKVVFYLSSKVEKNTVDMSLWKSIPEDLDTTQTEIIYYHGGGFENLQSIEPILNRIFGVLDKEKIGKIPCLVDKNGTVVLIFDGFLVMFKNKKGFFMPRKNCHGLEEFFSCGSFCTKCENVISFRIKIQDEFQDCIVSVCVACGNFVSTVPNFTIDQFCLFLSSFNFNISRIKPRFEAACVENTFTTIDDCKNFNFLWYQNLKFLKKGVSVNNVTYPDTVLLWGEQLYKILAEKWKI